MIYLNNAATSYPKAPGVPEAVGSTLRGLPGAANRGGIEDFDVLGETRKELALLMGVSVPKSIALGPNATWGLNSGIYGLNLAKGDVVLTTTAEHNSVLRPLYALSINPGITVHYLEVDHTGHVRLEDWEAALRTYKPRLCVVSHASNVTGAVNDAPILAALAHKHNALIMLDLAQSLGCEPVKLEEWSIDLAAFTGHKYLLGPQGTGGLYVTPGLDLNPLLTGGTGIHSDLDTMPPNMPLHLEAGTNNEPGFSGLLQALRWQRINPWPGKQVTELLVFLKAELQQMGARVINPGLSEAVKAGSIDSCTPVVSFTLPGFIPDYLGETLLDSYDIIVRTGLHCAPRIFACLGVDPAEGTVRVSLSRFTTQEEIDELLVALREVIESEEG